MSREAQSTDAANDKALIGATNVGSVKSSSLGSVQEIARDTSDQNTATGSGATPVTAPVKAGK